MEKKHKNEQPWTLAYNLVLQTMRFCLSSFIFSKPIGFPSKIMLCKLNCNLNCCGPRLSFKGLGINLKFLIGKNV